MGLFSIFKTLVEIKDEIVELKEKEVIELSKEAAWEYGCWAKKA